MMHLLLKEGFADRDYLARYTDFVPRSSHLAGKTPQWASAITGCRSPRSRVRAALRRHPAQLPARGLRLHALAQRFGGDARRDLLPSITGAWQHRAAARLPHLDNWRSTPPGARARPHEPATRCSTSRASGGPVRRSRRTGRRPAVTAMLMQNANSANVAPTALPWRAGWAGRSLPLRSRAVHDGDGEVCRYPPAGRDVPRYDDIYYGLVTRI